MILSQKRQCIIVHAWLPSSWTKLEGVLEGDQRIQSWLMCSNTFVTGSKIRQKTKYIPFDCINLIHCINVIIVLFLSLHTCQRNETVNNYPRGREKSIKYFCNMYAVIRIIWNALQVCYFLLQTTTKNPCGSKTCTCRKYGIRCLRFCGECRGTECTNSKACIRTLKRTKQSEIEKRKVTIFLDYLFTSSQNICL